MSENLKVSQLLKYISGMNPQNTPTRLSFFNFLKGFAHEEADLTTELIEQFFSYSLDYPHWAGSKNQLGHEVQFLLENFNGFYQHKFPVNQVCFPEKMQIIEIENNQDLLDASSKFIANLCNENDRYRLVNDQNKRMIAIILKADRSLEVKTIDKKFTIRKGVLEPLRKDLSVFYTPELELSSNHVQRIEVAPYITAQFKYQNGRVNGLLLRGYVFQKLLELKNDPLKEQMRLLLPLKRLEQFFIDRRTDPYYNENISQLERTCALIQQGDLEALKWSSIILTQAETALENIFIGDKLLTLLVRDLKHAISNSKFLPEAKEECLKITPIRESDLTN